MARLIDFDDLGHITLDRPKKFIVRYPREEEQAKSMTEVPRELREVEDDTEE